MTMTVTIWKDGDMYSGQINGSTFNKVTKETVLEDISAKMDNL